MGSGEDKANSGSGQGGGSENAKNTVTITVNTTDSVEPKGKITYQRIVEIGYPDFAGYPNATYSIMYERGPKANPEGTLSKNWSVVVGEGMRFRVKRTGES